MAAMDEPSLRAALDFMAGYEDGLSAVRYPRDTVSERFAGEDCDMRTLQEGHVARAEVGALGHEAGLDGMERLIHLLRGGANDRVAAGRG